MSSQNPCKEGLSRKMQTQLADALDGERGRGRGRGGRGRSGGGGRGGAALKRPAAAPQSRRAMHEEPEKKAEPNKDADESEAPEPPKKGKKAKPSKDADESEAPEPPKKGKKAKPSKDADESEAPEPPKKKTKAKPSKDADESEAPEPPKKKTKAEPKDTTTTTKSKPTEKKAATQDCDPDSTSVAATGKTDAQRGKVKTTFARRYCPKSGRNRYKWFGLRDAYEEQVAHQLDCPSKHEDYVFLDAFGPVTQNPKP